MCVIAECRMVKYISTLFKCDCLIVLSFFGKNLSHNENDKLVILTLGAKFHSQLHCLKMTLMELLQIYVDVTEN